MALDSFKPEIWTARLLANLHGRQVYTQAGVVNRDYEGEIRNFGDTVRIMAIGAITVRDYEGTSAGAITYEELEDDFQQLIIDQQKYFGFEVDDVDRVQARPEVMNEANREAAVALRKVADGFVASHYTEAGISINGGNPLALGSGDAYDLLVDMSVELDNTETPDDGRWAVVPPWFEGLMQKDERFVKTGSPEAESRLRNGIIGRAAGFTILKSTAVPQNEDDHAIVAGHPMAWSYAEQILNMEAFRSQETFADRVRGLHVYGGKVVRPGQLAVALASAE